MAPIAIPLLDATRFRSFQSPARSHGMWRATVGQMPVSLCTSPASAIFSSTVRAAPGCAKTLKRVPELPYPHDGVSTRSELMRSMMRASSIKMKNLRQHLVESGLGLDGALHDGCHLLLPTLSVGIGGHLPLEALEVG